MGKTAVSKMIPSAAQISNLTQLRAAAQRKIARLGTEKGLNEIPIRLIETRKQVRSSMDEERISDLVESIQAVGLLNPIIVVKHRNDDDDDDDDVKYVVIAGHRRLEACKRLNHETIPAIIRDVSEKDVAVLQLTENIAREDLKPHEIGDAFKLLHDKYELDYDQTAKNVGLSKGMVSKYVKLADAPEAVRELSAKGAVKDVVVLWTLAKISEKNPSVFEDLIRRGEFSRAHVERCWKKLRDGKTDANTTVDELLQEVLREKDGTPLTDQPMEQQYKPEEVFPKLFRDANKIDNSSAADPSKESAEDSIGSDQTGTTNSDGVTVSDDGKVYDVILNNSMLPASNDEEKEETKSLKTSSAEIEKKVDDIISTKLSMEQGTARTITACYRKKSEKTGKEELVECEIDFDADTDVANGEVTILVVTKKVENGVEQINNEWVFAKDLSIVNISSREGKFVMLNNLTRNREDLDKDEIKAVDRYEIGQKAARRTLNRLREIEENELKADVKAQSVKNEAEG